MVCLGICLENMILEKGGQIQPSPSLTLEVRIDRSNLNIYMHFLGLILATKRMQEWLPGWNYTLLLGQLYINYISKSTLYMNSCFYDPLSLKSTVSHT